MTQIVGIARISNDNPSNLLWNVKDTLDIDCWYLSTYVAKVDM